VTPDSRPWVIEAIVSPTTNIDQIFTNTVAVSKWNFACHRFALGDKGILECPSVTGRRVVRTDPK